MSIYERLREERDEKRKAKTSRKSKKRQLTGAQLIKEEADRKKTSAWRYYRAVARIRKRLEREIKNGNS